MSHVLEKRYRRLLRAYRETLSLLAGGFTVRARASRAAGVPGWADGLHLGALAVAVVTVAQLPVLPHLVFKVWTGVGVVLVVALVRGWTRVAAPLAAIAALLTSWPIVLGWLHGPVVDVGPLYGDLGPVAPYWVVAAASAALAVRRTGAGRASGQARWWGATMPVRSPWWLVVPPVCWALQLAQAPADETVWGVVRAGVEVVALLLVLAATLAARDGRWALAAAVYLVPGLVHLAENLPVTRVSGFLYWSVLTVLVAASLAAARRVRVRA
ncbi:hypothetical protein ACFYUV_29845 [Nonomuraea sp. NPDC003560]|uniref:hypothetical protein n=1 Tax=Nonomuraea sp. NPDC003560 TaxID=3364341 RepID=UPI00369173C0